MSDCGRYVILSPREGCDPVNRLFYVDLQTLPDGINGILPYIKVVDNFDAEYEVNMSIFSLIFFLICCCYIWQKCVNLIYESLVIKMILILTDFEFK